MSYMVAQRTDEIGVRMALGAQGPDMLRLVTADGMLRAGFGLLVGLLLSLALTRVLSSELFGVSPLDPFTFVSVLALFTITALAASYFPARRASRVVALRHG